MPPRVWLVLMLAAQKAVGGADQKGLRRRRVPSSGLACGLESKLAALTLVGVGGLLSPMNCVEQRLGNIRAEKAGTIIVAVQFSEA
jgi:hypothetical protein